MPIYPWNCRLRLAKGITKKKINYFDFTLLNRSFFFYLPMVKRLSLTTKIGFQITIEIKIILIIK